MKQVTLNIPENKFAFFMQLINALDFVQIAEPKSEYNPEFVDRIHQSRQEYQDGNYISIEKENLKDFLGIE